MAKSIKVKSLADKYSGATSTSVVEVLHKLGINNVPVSGTVPAEETERVEAHLAKIYGPPKSRGKKDNKATPKKTEKAEVKKNESESIKKTEEKTALKAMPAKSKAEKSATLATKPEQKTSTSAAKPEQKASTPTTKPEQKASAPVTKMEQKPATPTSKPVIQAAKSEHKTATPVHKTEQKASTSAAKPEQKASTSAARPEQKTLTPVHKTEHKASAPVYKSEYKPATPVAKPEHKPVISAHQPEYKPSVKPAISTASDIDEDEISAQITKPLLETKFEKIPRHNKPVPAGKPKPFVREKSDEKVFEKNSRKHHRQSYEHAQPPVEAKVAGSEIILTAPVTVKTFAEATGKRANEVITDLIGIGVFASINQLIPENAINKLCDKYGFKVKVEHRSKVEKTGSAPPKSIEFVDRPEDIKPRPPVVTFLGHVDHGKTSLQDKVRNTQVVDGESGHITQHIGASQVSFRDNMITFIDTPGHEAFTQMRARGANLTDIAILVVAADDGFMTQTVEALNHAKAAEVPIIVAVNKIDLPGVNADKILLQMQQNNLTSEEWGGDVGVIKVSAKTGEGIPELLERILLESEMLELRANPKRPAETTVLEAQMEHGLGATANVLVTNGTLKVGDAIVCGEFYGRVKTLINAQNQRIQSAGPSTPVKLIGLSGAPDAGASLEIKKNEKEARLAAEAYGEAKRQEELSQAIPATMEDMLSKIDSDNKKTLNMIVKSDVRGTAEAIEESLAKIDSEKISVSMIMSGVGAITENDIMLATASKAMVVGFHVRVNPGVNEMAKKNGVEIRLYTIIYELLEDITDAMTGRLQPDKREKELGQAKILQIFALTKGPKICGCKVEKGTVKVGSKARVYRDGDLIFNGDVASLRRFQDDVKEVRAGFECGIRLNNFADFIEGDVIELYEIEFTKATL